MITMEEVNALKAAEFEKAFGDVAEHSPWVARNAAGDRPFVARDSMIRAFREAVLSASETAQLALIRAHPDLATKAKLTDDSTREQAQAGLGTLSKEEFARFNHLNDLYKSKFDFPFIFAVKGATKQQILASFAERVNHSKEDEFAMALDQVCRIFRFRIEDRVAP
ncbi:MAG TPA: 2-oxo-4-hydroxy-4-carboxy-5-ureidoimidazoline decarboxylase [Aestuariivirga sp.]